MAERSTRPWRRTAPIALSLGLLLGACGSDGSSDATGASPNADDAARERVAKFTCPDLAERLDEPTPVKGRSLKVAVTVAPLTSIVANIAGDKAEVTGLVPEGENSHTFEPKPSMAATLADSDVIFLNGLTLEEPTRDLAEANRGKDASIVLLGDVTLDENQYLYDFSFPRDGGKPNPHLWTNPPMARCYAEIVATTLASADPANASTYQANAKAYTAKIDELDQAMVAATKTVPANNRRLLTYHDAYAYTSAHYGWTVVGAVQVSDFGDPSPKEVARLIDQVRDADLPAVFGSEVFPSDVLKQIADEAGARYVDVLRDDDLPGAPGDEDHSFLGLMRFDFVTMVRELGGDPAALEALDTTDVTPDRATYPQ